MRLKRWPDALVYRAAQRVNASPILKKAAIRGYRADIGEIDANVIRAALLINLRRTPAHELLDLLARHPEVRRVSSVSGQLDLIVELEAGSIDGLNRVRDLLAGHDIVEDLTTAIILRRDIDREMK